MLHQFIIEDARKNLKSCQTGRLFEEFFALNSTHELDGTTAEWLSFVQDMKDLGFIVREV